MEMIFRIIGLYFVCQYIGIIIFAIISFYFFSIFKSHSKFHLEKPYFEKSYQGGSCEQIYFNQKMNYCICVGSQGQAAEELCDNFLHFGLSGMFRKSYELDQDLEQCRIIFDKLNKYSGQANINAPFNKFCQDYYLFTTLPKTNSMWVEYPFRNMQNLFDQWSRPSYTINYKVFEYNTWTIINLT